MPAARRHWLKTVAALLATAPLAACGFRLRGSPRPGGQVEELGTVFVEAPPGSEVAGPLRQQLRLREASLAADAASADLRIELLEERPGRRALAIDNSGKVDEYELSLLLRYRIVRRGEEPGEPAELRQARSYRFEQSQVLGADAEAEVLRVELREALAASLVLQLSRL